MIKFFNHLAGNATEVSSDEISAELAPVLATGERIGRSFKVFRDTLVFTNARLIFINKQGLTGSKVSYRSVLYRNIAQFSVETAGTFDGDTELKVWVSGSSDPISQQFARGADIVGVQQFLASALFGNSLVDAVAPAQPLPSAPSNVTPPPLPTDDWPSLTLTTEERRAANNY